MVINACHIKGFWCNQEYVATLHYTSLSPAGGNTVEHRAHDRKVVGSNLAGGVFQWTELEENNKGPVVYGAVYGPGT